MKKSIVCMALASAGLWMSCSTTEKVTEKDLTGNWIEVMPVNQHIVQGVSLYEKGEASSIGMATLQYQHWGLTGDSRLVLEGKSIYLSGGKIRIGMAGFQTGAVTVCYQRDRRLGKGCLCDR